MTQHNLQQRVTIPLPLPGGDAVLAAPTAADLLGWPVRVTRRRIAGRRVRFCKTGGCRRPVPRDLGGSVAEGRLDPIRSPRR